MLTMVNMVMISFVLELQLYCLVVLMRLGLTSERPDINYKDDNGGHFHIRSVDTNNDELELILQTMLVSLQTIEEEYNENIRLN